MSDPHSRQQRRYLHLLASARRVIEPFETVNRYQQELKALLTTMMDYMEGAHCRPGTRLDEERDFDRWMGIVKRYWRALESPEMASRRARTVLAELLG